MPDTTEPEVVATEGAPAPDPAPTTGQEHLDAVAKEYGTFVATVPIDINGARAFNPGDPVPNSHVSRGVVTSSMVARRGTKAAAAVLDDTTTKG